MDTGPEGGASSPVASRALPRRRICWRPTGRYTGPATPGLTSGFLEPLRGIPIGCQCAFGCGPDGDPAERVVAGMSAIDCCRTSSLSVRAEICSESFFISAR